MQLGILINSYNNPAKNGKDKTNCFKARKYPRIKAYIKYQNGTQYPFYSISASEKNFNPQNTTSIPPG